MRLALPVPILADSRAEPTSGQTIEWFAYARTATPCGFSGESGLTAQSANSRSIPYWPSSQSWLGARSAELWGFTFPVPLVAALRVVWHRFSQKGKRLEIRRSF